MGDLEFDRTIRIRFGEHALPGFALGHRDGFVVPAQRDRSERRHHRLLVADRLNTVGLLTPAAAAICSAARTPGTTF